MKPNARYTRIRTGQTVAREVRKRVPIPPERNISGFTTAIDGDEEVTFDVYLDEADLREVARRVESPSAPEIRALVKDLADTLAYWRKTTGYGRGIAAPQLGKSVRVIFLQLPGAEPWPLINPEIVQRSEEKIVVWDACLSFLSIFMKVERNREITVRYQDLRGERREIHANDERDLSELLQHEIDHLEGILCLDRMTDIRTLCTKEEFERRYRPESPYAFRPAEKKKSKSGRTPRRSPRRRHGRRRMAKS